MARPTKLTPETSAAITKALTIGATRKDAVGAAGVEYQTFLNWMERGEKSKTGLYFGFFDAVTRAEHDARLKYTSVIAKAAQEGDWRAALEYLKRRDRDNWGDNMTLNVNESEIDNAIKRELARLADTRQNADAGQASPDQEQ